MSTMNDSILNFFALTLFRENKISEEKTIQYLRVRCAEELVYGFNFFKIIYPEGNRYWWIIDSLDGAVSGAEACVSATLAEYFWKYK